jgi:hypothetical protein
MSKLREFIADFLGGDGPEPEPFVSRVIVQNNTDEDLHMSKANPASLHGTYLSVPPRRIPAGGPGKFLVKSQLVNGEGLVGGAFSWKPEQPRDGEEWTISFRASSNSPQGDAGSDIPNKERFVADKQVDGRDFTFSLSPVPEPEPEWKPPSAPSRQPTLRFGDNTKDGWVEYLQQLLNFHMNAGLTVDGIFLKKTYGAVCDFQRKKRAEGLDVMDDGIVGNQTWGLLREGAFEKPSTDGRKPHTYEEKGAQARWRREKETCVFIPDFNEAWLFLNAVGEQPIDDFKAIVQVTTLSGTVIRRAIKIGPPNQRMPNDQGNVHIVKLKPFRETFMPDKDENGNRKDKDSDVSAYQFEAYFEKHDIIGTDHCKGFFAVG